VQPIHLTRNQADRGVVNDVMMNSSSREVANGDGNRLDHHTREESMDVIRLQLSNSTLLVVQECSGSCSLAYYLAFQGNSVTHQHEL
jgi:hypothetical protein